MFLRDIWTKKQSRVSNCISGTLLHTIFVFAQFKVFLFPLWVTMQLKSLNVVQECADTVYFAVCLYW